MLREDRPQRCRKRRRARARWLKLCGRKAHRPRSILEPQQDPPRRFVRIVCACAGELGCNMKARAGLTFPTRREDSASKEANGNESGVTGEVASQTRTASSN